MIKQRIRIISSQNGGEEQKLLKASFDHLRLLRLWPKRGETSMSKKQFIEVLIILALATFMPVIAIMHLMHIYTTPGQFVLDDLMADIVVLAAATSLYCMVGIFLLKNNEVSQVIRLFSDHVTFPKPAGFDRADQFNDQMTHFFAAYSAVGVLIYAGFGVKDGAACLSENEEKHLERICGLMTPAALPAYFQHWPYYHAALAAQIANCIFVIMAAYLIVLLVCSSVNLVVTHVHQLREMLQEVFTIEDVEVRRKRLKFCVEYHIYIIKLSDGINQNLGLVTFMHSTFTSAILALLGFQFLLYPQLRTLVHAMGWASGLFLVCYFGQQIINESTEIPNAAYSSDWFMGDVDAQRYILMLIWRANRNLYLDAYGFGFVGFSTFAGALQTAYSFLTLLHQTLEV